MAENGKFRVIINVVPKEDELKRTRLVYSVESKDRVLYTFETNEVGKIADDDKRVMKDIVNNWHKYVNN